MWKTSACGKVILLGEHAVVYGVPALCGALQGGVEVEAIAGEGRLLVPEWDVATPPLGELLHPPTDAVLSSLSLALRAIVEHSFAAVGRTLSFRDLPYDFVARFAIPTGAGLGSSAALSVALVRAVDRAASLGLRESDVDAAAFAAEKVFHGSPSGLDHTVAQRGGFGLFRRGQGLTPVLDTPPLRLCIAHTGKARDTKGRVARVAELTREQPEMTASVFQRIGELVSEAVDALALVSQQRAKKAIDEGRFAKSVVPVLNADGSVALDREEFPRPETTAEGLASLKPSFEQLADFEINGTTFKKQIPKGPPKTEAMRLIVKNPSNQISIRGLKFAAELTEIRLWIVPRDRDGGAVEMSRANAARAGVDEVTAFRQCAVSAATAPGGPVGLIIANPPYGQRIGDKKKLFSLYSSFGQTMLTRFKGWRVAVITNDAALAGACKLPFGTPFGPVSHGGQRVHLYLTEPLP